MFSLVNIMTELFFLKSLNQVLIILENNRMGCFTSIRKIFLKIFRCLPFTSRKILPFLIAVIFCGLEKFKPKGGIFIKSVFMHLPILFFDMKSLQFRNFFRSESVRNAPRNKS